MIEAMKQALEALEQWNTPLYKRATAIKSLRQAIEQAEKQEPVAWQDTQKTWVDVPLKNVLEADYERGFIDGMQKQMQSSVDKAVNAMSKREWVGLTDEEIMEMLDYGQYGRVPQYARNFVDAIEAKLKEKNT
jgi:uncharacterized protein (DUF305 family)